MGKRIFLFINLLSVLLSSILLASGEERPLREGTFDLPEMFKNPPNGYGEVPFYWWMGDKLERKHILAHLEELKGKGIQSLQVNYAHSDKGGYFWGVTYRSDPPLISDKWWDLFAWFKSEANKRGMSVSLSDYTLGLGQGQFLDRALAEDPALRARALNEFKAEFKDKLNVKLPCKKPLCAAIYSIASDGKLLPNTRENVSELVDADGFLKLERRGRHILVCVYPQLIEVSYDPTNPDSGKLYIKHFFEEFERRLGGCNGLNFFFSDELDFRIEGRFVWSEYLQSEFKKAKGYDIGNCADLLFVDYPDLSAKIKLDYNDVFVSLSEKNFFKPVYDWHESRGMIYGCDHGSRGKKVDEFGDYFRIIRWNQGPGCDQPHGESDLIKNKVASSISHMYKRPRVWLEGFYASNWGQTPQHLSDAIFSNFAMGQNLLSLHGLYYSTMGGWWEWAPPCNHFRQPYWKEMPTLLKCVQRLSFLLSQGTHRADIAIMYPLEPKVAGLGTMSVDLAFGLADRLYNSGRDFDFMDAESIERAAYSDGKIKVSGEEFEVLIIPAMEAMRQSTLESLASLARAGARIWFLEPTPKVSDWLENFPGGNQISELERSSAADTVKSMLKLESVRVFNNSDELIESMVKSFQADFKILSGKVANPRVLHRNINGDDYYCLYNIPAGSVCEFRAEGKVTLLDPFSGKERDINVICQQNGVSTISTPLNSTDFQILRFNRHKKATFAKSKLESEKLLSSQELSGKWNFYFKPVLDNSRGDFEWPPSNELIGPQIRFVRSRQNLDAGNEKSELEQIGFSSKLLILGPLEKPILTSNADDIFERFAENSEELKISMRFGVLGDSAHQGYHGLKAEISDDFIRLGKIVVGDTSMIRTAENAGNYYYLYTKVYAPHDGYFKILTGDMRPGEIFLNGELIDSLSSSALLRRGANELILRYDSHGATHFLFCDTDAPDTQFEFAIKQAPLSMSWNGKKNILPFDAITDFSSPISLSFESAPALKEFQFTIMGDEVKVLVNGKAAELHLLSVGDDSAKTYKARVGNVSKGTSNVEISVNKPMPGFGAAAALRGYIRQTCAVGEIELSSWDKFEGMRTYSGGAVYSKEFELSRNWVGKRIELDLGKVGGLARVRLNGKDASVRF